MNQYDQDESEEDVDLTEVRAGPLAPAMTVGVSASGVVFIKGDIHPLGSATALLTAAAQHVPYIAVSAVEVLYPADWLRGECLGDPDRLRIIDNIESFARSGFSQGAKTRH
jgi:hypothetical protein